MISNANDISPSFDTNASALDAHVDVPASGRIDGEGNVQHNVDLSRYAGKEEKAAEAIIEKFVHTIDNLEKQLELACARGDDATAQRIESALNELKTAFTELKSRLESGEIQVTEVANGVENGGFNELVAGLGVAVSRSDMRLQAPEGYGSADSVEDHGAGGSTSSVGGSTSASGEADTDADAFPEAFQKSPAELAAWFESDPEGFFAALKDVKSEDRGAILMMVQQNIQQTNQLFSMLTNFQSAIHDTQKAMISNLRV